VTVLQQIETLQKGMEKNGLQEIASLLGGMADDLRGSVSAIMEGIEEGRPEDALECCGDLI